MKNKTKKAVLNYGDFPKPDFNAINKKPKAKAAQPQKAMGAYDVQAIRAEMKKLNKKNRGEGVI